MGKIGKSFSVILILIMAISNLSLLMVKPVFAQSIAAPSVPQFSVKYVGLFYDSLAYADNRTLFFSIRNQPFTPYKDSDINEIGLYYNFRVKEHSGDQWYYYPFGPNDASTWLYGKLDMGSLSGPLFNASNSDFTTAYVNFYSFFDEQAVPSNSQLDVQVQALIGQIGFVFTGLLAGKGYNFTGYSSNWSNIHTITLTEGSTSTDISSLPSATLSATKSSTISPEPTIAVPELSWQIIVSFLLSPFSVALVLRHRRSSHLVK